MNNFMATLLGICAILLWATLAALTVLTFGIPVFEWLALTLGLAGLLALVLAILIKTKSSSAKPRFPLGAFAFTTAGIFGYHYLYFTALNLIAPAYSSLILYLWPLLIVVFNALLYERALKWQHALGVLLGFVAMICLLLPSLTQQSNNQMSLIGLGVALAGAFVWSGYSVLNRSFAAQSHPLMLPAALLACAGLALILSLSSEVWVWPNFKQSFGLLALALGPMGFAFYCWDIGTKKGNLGLLGVISYSTPILSTLLLVVLGMQEGNKLLYLASFLVTLAALIASTAKRKAQAK